MGTRDRIRAGKDRRAQTVALAAAGCLLVLAGCGSSSPSSGGSGSKRASAGIRFSACMRAHGVPNFPDPSASGGIQLSSSSGLNPASPSFQSAQNTCSKLMPGGGPGRPQSSEQRRLELVALAECMRRHGLSTFPDPVASPPSPGPGLGLAFGGPGAFIAVSQSMMQSPAFSQAAAECNFPGAGRTPGAKRAPKASVP